MEKDTCLDHLQKQNDELRSSLSKFRDEVIKEFKMSKEFIDLLDENYAAGFKDFRMDAIESFLGVDFDSIKLRTIAESSLLQTSLEDVNIKDDASTLHPAKDGSKFGGNASLPYASLKGFSSCVPKGHWVILLAISLWPLQAES